MFRNYLLTAFRNLSRNKSYALINMFGLAVGIASCLLIFLVVDFESSFDNFHKKRADIYRIGTELHNQGAVSYTDAAPFPTAAGIRVDYPEIKEVASIFQHGAQINIENGDAPVKKFVEDNFYYTEPEFFRMFDFGWVSGDAQTSLKDPNSVVLSQATAEKLFGDWKSALGKTIKYDNKTLYRVTGILKNVPYNSDFPLKMVVSFKALNNTWIKDNLNDWVSTYGGAYVFVVLPKSLPLKKFNASLAEFSKRHKPAEYAIDKPILQPLKEIHYDERFGNFNDRTFSHSLINSLSIIGLFLIVIACVNFINLATAQAINRAKEVGVRKVLGSNRLQLIAQFLGEAVLITIAAVVFAIMIAVLALPLLNGLLETHLTMKVDANPIMVLFLLVIAVLVSFLSGLYPAIIMSGFNPVTALKSRVNFQVAGGLSLRRILVVLQFAIAQILIIGTLIVVSQMNYFRNASLGFDKAAVINVPFHGDSSGVSKINSLRNSLLQNPSIDKVSFSFGSPSSDNNWNSDFKFDRSAKTTDFSANLKWADPEYFRTFNIRFVAGRCYYPSDTVREFVVNETLLSKLGIQDPKKAIGKQINFWDGRKVGNIVGVIRDFNVFSLRRPVTPVVLSTWAGVYQTINIKIKPGAEKAVLPFIEKLWNEAFPDNIYEYRFLDDTIERFYKQENQLSELYKIFAVIAIAISCLGLYGLVSFMAERRTKEMGIRKVLGASARNIVYLLSKEFTLLILIAFIISAPIAYFVMHDWLQNYSYRIPLEASIFFLTIFISIVIAWITVGQRAIKAAVANPVKSLRTE